jgi:phenylpropionate dioxygenase-like ring-hydroxylating dioxygenase large terminal subunit
VATSAEVRTGPFATRLHGVPIVVWRSDNGDAAAFVDRCPHRNVPLSLGAVCGAHLRCAYHGWEFDGAGACKRIPALSGIVENRARNASRFEVLERDGYVWVWGDRDSEPDTDPYALPEVGPGYTTVRYEVEAEGSLHATIENALDVPHTAFLHGGLFRSDRAERHEVTAVVTRGPRHVEAEYIGEPRPPGVAARILSPSGGVVTHFDRFLLPSIAQVEYRLGADAHFRITSFCTPLEDFRTRLFAVAQFRVKLLPGFIVRPFLEPVALRIFRQDAHILRAQTAAIRAFGEERFASTEIDVLGAQILRLMRRAAGGAAPEEPDDYRKEITLRI